LSIQIKALITQRAACLHLPRHGAVKTGRPRMGIEKRIRFSKNRLQRYGKDGSKEKRTGDGLIRLL